jgi:nucleoside phosphorylase/transcriptional regulator NrdR family protein
MMPKCKLCSYVSANPHDLKQHKDGKQHWLLPHKCMKCHEEFTTKMAADQHMMALRHYKPNIPCQGCDERFLTPESVEQHMKAKGHYKTHSATCVIRNVTMTTLPRRPAMRRDFEVAVICALTSEADAVAAVFDHHWDDNGPPYDKASGDPNAYSTGAIGRHNVVLAHMPGMGTVNAAAVASSCRTSFPNIKLALVVGICGVSPFGGDRQPEIVLGDVVISDAVIQYDFGRQQPHRFVRKDTLLDSLGRPNMEIRALLAKLKGLRDRRALKASMVDYLDKLRADPDLHANYPGVQHDRLFESSYMHARDQESCDKLGCNGKLVSRTRLAGESPQPDVHFGLIASGNTVIRSGVHRDAIIAEEHVAAFEMEGAGVWDVLPCLVIKSACDYADSHKNKKWQHYAAATAAVCMKGFLHYWAPSSPDL